MDVHEAGRRQTARAVDPTSSLDRRRGAVSDDVDAPVPDHEMPAGVLLVEVIDRGDRAAVDDQRFRDHPDTAEGSTFTWFARSAIAAPTSPGCRRLITNYRQRAGGSDVRLKCPPAKLFTHDLGPMPNGSDKSKIITQACAGYARAALWSPRPPY